MLLRKVLGQSAKAYGALMAKDVSQPSLLAFIEHVEERFIIIVHDVAVVGPAAVDERVVGNAQEGFGIRIQ